MTRSEIIELVVVRAAPSEQQQLRKILSSYSIGELQRVEQAIASQAVQQKAEDELIRIQAERAADRALHEYHLKLHHDQAREAYLKQTEPQDRETFAKACRKFNIGNIEANFKLIRAALGPQFNLYQVGQAVSSGIVHVDPATEQEQQQWRQEAQKEHRDYLVNYASPGELRQAARQDSEQRRVQAEQQHGAQQIKTREEAEVSVGYQVLPEVNIQGVKLDAAFFMGLANTDIKTYRKYCNKYGFAAITARLNGVR